NQWRSKARGDVIIVRYADDAVLGFQFRDEAERFLQELKERMGKFGLELHPVKTRLFEFGRYAAERRKQREKGSPETFNFLGFTHICGTNRTTSYFTIIRQTISKRRAAKLKQIQAELGKRLHDPLGETTKWLQSVVRGYFQYHAVPGNEKSLEQFRSHVLRLWLRQIRRRSHRWYLVQYNPLKDESGQIIRWYNTATDIDDRKRAEDMLRQSEKELRAITDSVRQFIVVLAPDGTTLYANKLALENVGFTIRDLTNESLLTGAALPRQAEAPGELAWNQVWRKSAHPRCHN